jgi:DNA-binding winged helix-turn-helix (wHTH) protein
MASVDIAAGMSWILRKALDDDATNPSYIATVRSIGYRLITP